MVIIRTTFLVVVTTLPGRACGYVQEGGSSPVLCLREAVQKKGVHGRIYGARTDKEEVLTTILFVFFILVGFRHIGNNFGL